MKRILFSMFALMTTVCVRAQFSADPAVGTAIATTSPTTAKTANVSVSDGAGGVFIAWIDSRTSASQSIFIQRLLANGSKKFLTEVEITSSPNVAGGTSVTKSNLAIVSDDAGGAICIWQDARNTTGVNTNTDIYGQRVDADGNVLWTAGGKRITVSDNTVSNKIAPSVDMLNATEAIVVFGDNRLGTTDIFAQKIDLSNGNPVWANDVAVHGNLANTQTPANAALLADGAGGAFIIWQDPRLATSNNDIYAQKIDNSGTLLWGASGSVVTNVAASNQNAPQAALDGSGGIVVTWLDLRVAASDINIYAQRLDAAGTALWTTNGVAVCTASGNQNNPLIINSGSNFIISWADNRVAVSDRNIFAQSIDLSGNPNWAANGVAIVQATGNQPQSISGSSTSQVMLPDGSDGAVIFWDDARNGSSNVDIYAQKISAGGVVQWAADGVAVSSATGNQAGPMAVASLNGAFIVSWRDSRGGSTNGEIYAARVQATGSLPVRDIQLNAVAKSGRIDISWNTTGEENTSHFILEKSSDGVRFSGVAQVKAIGTGNGRYTYEDKMPLSGNNYYRIKAVDNDNQYRYSSVVTAQFSLSPKASIVLFPNPASQQINLRTANLVKGNYAMSVTDMFGRRVLLRQISIQSDVSTWTIPIDNLGRGIYVLKVEGKDVMQVLFEKQ
jgi:hypothetical protein